MTLIRLLSFALCSYSAFVLAQDDSGPTQDGLPDKPMSEVISRGVIGLDDRQSSDALPAHLAMYKIRVGQLISRYARGDGTESTSTCSGSLIKPNYIITAAHCAFNSDGQLHTNQLFYPGKQTPIQAPYDKYKVKQVFLPAAYYQLRGEVEAGSDIAIMELEPADDGTPAGTRTGHFGFWGRTEFKNGLVSTIGYPGDKQRSHQHFQENCSAQVEHQQSNRIIMDCDVYQGQSGSPIMVYSDQYENYYIEGVINSESAVINYGARLSKERGRIIKYIVRDEFDSQAFLEEQFSERWLRIKAPSLDTIHVYAKNNCTDNDLYVAYNYKDTSGSWETKGYYKVPPLGDVEIFNTANGVYYLEARNAEGRSFTRGETTSYLALMERDISLQKYQVDKFGNFTYGFGCR